MKPPRWPLAVGVVTLVAIISAFHLVCAGRGYPDYRDQHLGTALLYAEGRIDLLHPVIVGFNANNAPFPLELPVWQAVTAVLFKLFGPWYGWANVTSLLFFVTALWPLFQLARRYVGERGAWWTLLFFCAQPLVFLMAGRGGTDGSCEVFAIWFVHFADALVRTGKWIYWLPAFVCGALAALTKLPFFFCTGLAALFLLLLHGRKSVTRWMQLGTVGLAAALLFLIWHHHMEICHAQGEFNLANMAGPEVRGTVAESLYTWSFGTWSYRLNPWNWLHGAWRFGGAMFGSLALAGLAFWSLLYPHHRLARFWIAAALLTTLVFSHLVLHHQHYYLMFSPGVALLCAAAAARLEELVGPRELRQQLIVAAAALAVLLLSTLQGLMWLNAVLVTDPYPRRIAGVIRHYTGAQDKLLIQGGGWGGEVLFLSDRHGLSIWSTRFLEDPTNLARIKTLGYTRLVMISESPLLHAVQRTKPGQTALVRNRYEQQLTPVARDWKIIFQDDDILIKEIPQQR